MAQTADKIITDPEVIEQIRSAMPEAGVNEKGLMSSSDKQLLQIIDISYNSGIKIKIGRVYGVFRFVLWSETSEVSFYLIDAYGGNISFIGGYNITSSANYSFTVESEILYLNYKGPLSPKITHIKGIFESLR